MFFHELYKTKLKEIKHRCKLLTANDNFMTPQTLRKEKQHNGNNKNRKDKQFSTKLNNKLKSIFRKWYLKWEYSQHLVWTIVQF